MKTKHITLFLFAMLGGLSISSCLNDDFLLDWDKAKETTIIELPYRTHTLVASNQLTTSNYTFNLLVNCCAVFASDIKQDIPVGIAVDQNLVNKYNTENGLDGTTAARQPYILMPAAAYAFPATVTIKTGIRESEFSVPVNTSMLTPGVKYLIPLVISSAPAPYVISGNFGMLYLRVDMRAL